MRNPRDALSLLGGGGGEQGAGAAEEDAFPPAVPHAVEQQPAQHSSRAAAARAATVDVLAVQVVDQGAAVRQVGELKPLLVQQLRQKLVTQLAQIAGNHQIVVRGLAAGVPEVGQNGVGGGGGRSEISTMLFHSLLKLLWPLPASPSGVDTHPGIGIQR